MKLQVQQAAFAHDIAKLIMYVFEQGFTVTFGEAYRTQEQAEIYEKEGKGIRDSLHCKRLAIDIFIFNKEGNLLQEKHDYEPFGEYWASLDPKNRWGGIFPRVDCVHFERREE